MKNIILFLFLSLMSAKESSRGILVLTNGNTLNGEILSRNYKEIKFYSSQLDLTQDGIYIIKSGVLVTTESGFLKDCIFVQNKFNYL